MSCKTFLKELSSIKDVCVLREVPLAPLTTFRIGGSASIFIMPFNVSGLEKAIERLDRYGKEYFVLGNGSNLLIDDRGVDTVISLERLVSIDCRNNNISVGSGRRLMSLAAWAIRRGISGFEEFSGIPASAGGAVRMNAGVGSVSFMELVQTVLITGAGGSREVSAASLETDYRKTVIPSDTVVSSIKFKKISRKTDSGIGFSFKGAKYIRARTREVMSSRREKQPLAFPSAGCIFKNTKKVAAGMLVDKCGLKGTRIGDAEVSSVHANFIINRGRATFDNVTELMSLVQRRVLDKTGCFLEPEVVIWQKTGEKRGEKAAI